MRSMSRIGRQRRLLHLDCRMRAIFHLAAHLRGWNQLTIFYQVGNRKDGMPRPTTSWRRLRVNDDREPPTTTRTYRTPKTRPVDRSNCARVCSITFTAKSVFFTAHPPADESATSWSPAISLARL